MATLVTLILTALACLVCNASAYNWLNENFISKSSSLWHGVSYTRSTSLSSSHTAAHFPAATLSSAGPALTLSTSIATSVPTLTIFTIVTATPSMSPTAVLFITPTQSSTWEYTAVEFIPFATPTTAESPTFQLPEDPAPLTTVGISPFPEHEFELSSDSEITDTQATVEELQPSLRNSSGHPPSLIEDPTIPVPRLPADQPSAQNLSGNSDQQSRPDSCGAFGSSTYVPATYHEAESLNSTRLNATSSLKRRWDSDNSSVFGSEVQDRWESHNRAFLENLQKSEHLILPTAKAKDTRPEIQGQSGKASSVAIGSVLSPLLYLLKPRRKKRPPDSPSKPVDKKNDSSPQAPLRSISQEQLVSEIKGIYAGLVMVEAKCIEVDAKQTSLATDEHGIKLNNKQWQALIALHRTLLHEHHDFFLASLHPSASPALRRLASKYAMPARMWRHGIFGFLELLRLHLPASLDHMLVFIHVAYDIMARLYDSVPAFEDTWIECLGDLIRYRFAIEDDDHWDRARWAHNLRQWYRKASDRAPTTGRLYHHLAILARPSRLLQLFFFEKALIVAQPYQDARDSMSKILFDPLLNSKDHPRTNLDDDCYLKLHASLIVLGRSADFKEDLAKFMDSLDQHIANLTEMFLEQGFYIAVANCIALSGFGSHAAPLTRATWSGQPLPSEDEETHASGGIVHITASSMFNESRELFLLTVARVFQGADDVNTHSFLHATLVFLVHLAQFPEAMELLQADLPWIHVVSILNKRFTPFDISYDSFQNAEFSSSDSQPLPEDFEMRGFPWTEDYFPLGWFTNLDENREVCWESGVSADQRWERILGLSCRLARYEQWIIYDTERKEFSLPVTKPTPSISSSETSSDTGLGSITMDLDMLDFSSMLDWEASHTLEMSSEWAAADTSATYNGTKCSLGTPPRSTDSVPIQFDMGLGTPNPASPPLAIASLPLDFDLSSHNNLLPPRLQEPVDVREGSSLLSFQEVTEVHWNEQEAASSLALENLTESSHLAQTQFHVDEIVFGSKDTNIDRPMNLPTEPTQFLMGAEHDLNENVDTSFSFMDSLDQNIVLLGELPFAEFSEFLDFSPGSPLETPFQRATTVPNFLTPETLLPLGQISVLHAETYEIPNIYQAPDAMKYSADNQRGTDDRRHPQDSENGHLKDGVGDQDPNLGDNAKDESRPSLHSTFGSVPPPPPPATTSTLRHQSQFICPYCSKPFSRQCDLNKHIICHTRPFPCTVQNCLQRFPTSKDQARHLEDRHGDGKPWFCRHVDCVDKRVLFKRKDNMRKHWRRAHGRNPEPDEE